MNKVQLVEVKREVGFVNIGYYVDYKGNDIYKPTDDILMTQFNFMVNGWSWGVVIVDPEGNTTVRTAQIGETIKDIFVCCDGVECRYDIVYCNDCECFDIFIR